LNWKITGDLAGFSVNTTELAVFDASKACPAKLLIVRIQLNIQKNIIFIILQVALIMMQRT
jgi:hypothetical protein